VVNVFGGKKKVMSGTFLEKESPASLRGRYQEGAKPVTSEKGKREQARLQSGKGRTPPCRKALILTTGWLLRGGDGVAALPKKKTAGSRGEGPRH